MRIKKRKAGCTFDLTSWVCHLHCDEADETLTGQMVVQRCFSVATFWSTRAFKLSKELTLADAVTIKTTHSYDCSK